MEYKLSQFDQIYDGYFSVAVRIVDVHVASNGFTIDEYAGKSSYLEAHFAKFDALYEYISSLVKTTSSRLSDDDEETIAKMRMTLDGFGGRCKPSYFLYSYLQLMIIASGYDKEHIMYQTESLFTQFLAFDRYDIERSMIDFDTDFPNLVPFLSPRGYMGINTFLYLFFNNLCPVGVSVNPIPVHGERYRLPLDFTMHDVHHYYYYYRLLKQELLKGYDEIFDYIEDSKAFSSDYYDRLKMFYKDTIFGDYSLDDKKFRLLCAFYLIHEQGQQLSVLTDDELKFNEEELRLVYLIPSYSPIALGFSQDQDQQIHTHISLSDYAEYVMPDLVEQYRTLIASELVHQLSAI